MNGVEASDNAGLSVSAIGDINGDGLDDVIIGAFLANPSGKNDAGQAYVVYVEFLAKNFNITTITYDNHNND